MEPEDIPSVDADAAALIAVEAANATARAQEQMLQMRAEMARLRETIRAEFDPELDAAHIRIADLQEVAAQARSEAEAARMEAAHARDALEAVLASNSWRAMAPVRSLKLWVRGRRRGS